MSIWFLSTVLLELQIKKLVKGILVLSALFFPSLFLNYGFFLQLSLSTPIPHYGVCFEELLLLLRLFLWKCLCVCVGIFEVTRMRDEWVCSSCSFAVPFRAPNLIASVLIFVFVLVSYYSSFRIGPTVGFANSFYSRARTWFCCSVFLESCSYMKFLWSIKRRCTIFRNNRSLHIQPIIGG